MINESRRRRRARRLLERAVRILGLLGDRALDLGDVASAEGYSSAMVKTENAIDVLRNMDRRPPVIGIPTKEA
jgi:hypothetical protein